MIESSHLIQTKKKGGFLLDVSLFCDCKDRVLKNCGKVIVGKDEVINLVFTHRIFGYRVREQLSDILPNLLLSVVVATTTWGILRLLDFGDHLVHIVTGRLLFGFLFMALSRVFGMKGFRLMLDLWK